MRASFRRSQPEALQYLQNNWLRVKLPKIAKFGTDTAFYLFNTIASRAESAYHSIKDALSTSNSDFKFVTDLIRTMLRNQQITQHNVINTDRVTAQVLWAGHSSQGRPIGGAVNVDICYEERVRRKVCTSGKI